MSYREKKHTMYRQMYVNVETGEYWDRAPKHFGWKKVGEQVKWVEGEYFTVKTTTIEIKKMYEQLKINL